MNEFSCLIMESGSGFRSRERDGDASSPSDEFLMERVTEGNHDAFSQLVRRHTPRMYAIARRIGILPTEAEEIVQEAFLRVWVNAATWSPQRRFRRLAGTDRVNLCIDRLRRDRYEPWATTSRPARPAGVHAFPARAS